MAFTSNSSSPSVKITGKGGEKTYPDRESVAARRSKWLLKTLWWPQSSGISSLKVWVPMVHIMQKGLLNLLLNFLLGCSVARFLASNQTMFPSLIISPWSRRWLLNSSYIVWAWVICSHRVSLIKIILVAKSWAIHCCAYSWSRRLMLTTKGSVLMWECCPELAKNGVQLVTSERWLL